jgi:hypothetical protein
MGNNMKEKFADFLGWTGFGMFVAGAIEAAKDEARQEALGEEPKATTNHWIMIGGFLLALLAALLGGGKEEKK